MSALEVETPASPSDPINRQILEVSEDRVRGFVRDPMQTIAELSGLPMPTVVDRIRTMLAAGTIRRVRQTLLATNLAQGALIAWKIDVDILEVVHARAAHSNPVVGHTYCPDFLGTSTQSF